MAQHSFLSAPFDTTDNGPVVGPAIHAWAPQRATQCTRTHETHPHLITRMGLYTLPPQSTTAFAQKGCPAHHDTDASGNLRMSHCEGTQKSQLHAVPQLGFSFVHTSEPHSDGPGKHGCRQLV